MAGMAAGDIDECEERAGRLPDVNWLRINPSWGWGGGHTDTIALTYDRLGLELDADPLWSAWWQGSGIRELVLHPFHSSRDRQPRWRLTKQEASAVLHAPVQAGLVRS